MIPWLGFHFSIFINFPLETLEIVSIFYFWGIPRWYHFAVYSSSVGLSWFVNLPRLALLRIELRTLGLPVGCSTIELIVDLYTVVSIMPGFLNASHLYSVLPLQLVLTTLNSPMIELTQPGVWNSLYICDIAFSQSWDTFALDISNQPELSWFASWPGVDTPRVWSLG